VVILFTRKNKDVFLEDKIMETRGNEEPTAASRDGSCNISQPYDVQVPERFRTLSEPKISHSHLPQPAQGSSTPNFSRPRPYRNSVSEWAPSEQKPDILLCLNNNNNNKNWERTHSIPTNPTSPHAHKSYYAPMPPHKANYDSYDDESLRDDEQNSAYVPVPSSSVNDTSYDSARYENLSIEDENAVEDKESFRPVGRFSLCDKTRLGDAY
jgi:hypothetical protein